jgi:hypothetical protein
MLMILPPAFDHARADQLRQFHQAMQISLHDALVLVWLVFLERPPDIHARDIREYVDTTASVTP